MVSEQFPDPDKWVDISSYDVHPPEPDGITDRTRELFRILDSAL